MLDGREVTEPLSFFEYRLLDEANKTDDESPAANDSPTTTGKLFLMTEQWVYVQNQRLTMTFLRNE